MDTNIYYLCPDMLQPSGGIKRLYQHVEILRGEGYPAFVLHFKAGFKISWFETDAPVRYLDQNNEWNPKDIIVFPEGFSGVMKKLQDTPFRKVVIALSHSYIFPQLPFGETWVDYGVEAVLTPSTIIKDFISNSMGIEHIYLFKTSIDHTLFHFRCEKKKLQVAYIPRKDDTANVLSKILAARKKNKIDFVRIENRPISEYAEILKESTIFLATSTQEGIHRSVIEAMACGCICVGYDGIGAKEYIVPEGEEQNFVLAESSNYIELSQKLEKTISQLKNNSPEIELIKKNAIQTASVFSSEAERVSILEFWRDFLQRN